MPITSWISGLLGSVADIPGKVLNLKKTKLEIDKLKRETKRESSRITPATLEDVKKYDPKVREIERRVEEDKQESNGLAFFLFFILLALLGSIIASIQRLIEWIKTH
jgi:hypothetical protein